MRLIITILLVLTCSIGYSQIYALDEFPLADQGTFVLAAGSNNTALAGTPGYYPFIKYRARLLWVSTISNWTKIDCSASHCVGIKSDSTLWTWGDATNGKLANGSTTTYIIAPSQVGSAKYIDADVGNQHTMAVKSDGTLWAAGLNTNSQLGDGGTSTQSSLVQIGVATTWSKVACGTNYGMAIRTDGTLWSWGHNADYRTGLGTNTGNTASPTQVGSATDWAYIAAGIGSAQSLGVKTGGTLWSWGDSGSGKLGVGGGDVSAPAQRGSDTNWSKVFACNNFSFAIKTTGSLWSCGANAYGRTGLGTNSGNTTSWTQVGSDTDWSYVSGGQTTTGVHGFEYAIAIKTDGSLYGVGINSQGQIGQPSSTTEVSTFTRIGSHKDVTHIACMGGSTIVVKSSTRDRIVSNDDERYIRIGSRAGKGMFWWGTNQSSRTGTGEIPPSIKYPYLPQYADTTTTWRVFECGYAHCVGLRADSTLWTWGEPIDGRLGNGSTTTWVTAPTQVGTAKYIDVSAGNDFCVAVKSDGTLWAWGDNSSSQLGDGTAVDITSPTQIGSATTWTDVDCGNAYTLALRSNGTMWSMGSNTNGRTGQGTTSGTTTTPTQIGSATTWAKISAGAGSQSLAIKTDGTLWTWGSGSSGKLGSGGTSDVTSPTQRGSDTNWDKVFALGLQSFAIKTTGAAFSCGLNQRGRTSQNTTANTNTTSFTQVGSDTDWKSFVGGIGAWAFGYEYTIGLKTNGKIYGAGWNNSGQLGMSNATDELGNFAQIGDWTDIQHIASMAGATFIVRN